MSSYHPNTAARVAAMARVGTSVRDVCVALRMSPADFGDFYADVFDSAQSFGRVEIATRAYQMAKDGKHPQMTAFWLRSQADWGVTQESAAGRVPILELILSQAPKDMQSSVVHDGQVLTVTRED